MSRIFSGIQPSGELHIGNYLGAVKNWVALQQQLRLVLLHRGLPRDHRARTSRTICARARRDMAVSLLAAGLDPERLHLFVQSHGAGTYRARVDLQHA